MAVTIINYTGDGSTNQFAVTFSYLDEDDVQVTVNEVAAPFTFVNSSTVQITSTPASGDRIVVKRNTPVSPLVDFTDGSTLFEADLDLADQQSRYLGEEARDRADSALDTVNDNLTDVLAVAAIKQDVSDVAAVDADVTTVATNLNGSNTIGTVAGIDSNVTTVAGIASDVTTVANNNTNVTTTATNIANVNTVAGNNTNVTTVAGISADVTTVANNNANVTTVANNDANVSTVAGISSDVTTVANNDANVTAVAGNASDISTVAGINTAVSSVATNNTNVTTTATNIANVNTVAGNITNVNNVGAIDSDVSTVAGISADVTTVAADGTDIGTVSTNIANVNAVATNSTNINAVAGNATNINAVAADAADIGTVSSNISDVNTVAGISGNVTTVAGINANVTTVAGISSDVSTVAGDTTNIGTIVTNLNGSDTIGTVATNISNVNAVGADIANVNTAATNLTSINSFADTYRIGTTDPTTDLDAGDLFYNTTSGTLKVYSGSGWEQGVTAGSGFLPLTGGTLSGNLVFSGTETVDGRDVSVDGAKLDGIEAGADVTDANNVQAAGALMDSEVTNLAQVKAFDSSNYATAAQGTTADAALPKAGGTMTGAITFAAGQTFDGRDVSADGSKLDGIEANAKDDQTITAGSGLTGGGTGNVTLSHADTSSQASVNNSGATVVQDVTIDTYGHVTGLGSKTMTLADLGYTGATNANYITNNNQLTNGAGYSTFTANQSLDTSSSPTFSNPNLTSALRMGGTQVLSSGRALTNIASIDATTAAAIGNAGVGGGGTIEATTPTDAGVTKGDPVGFDKNGKIRAVTSLRDIYSNTTSVTLSNNNYSGDQFSFDFNSAGDKIMATWYIHGGGSYRQYWAMAGTVNSNKTITWGSPVQFDTGSGSVGVRNPVVWCNNNSWVTRYLFYNGSQRRTRVRALQWGTGNTVTYGSYYEADSNYHNDDSGYQSLSRTNNGGFIYGSAPGSDAKIYAGTVSGTSISLGSGVTVVAYNYCPVVAVNPNTGKFVAYGYNGGSTYDFRVGTISGNTISSTLTQLSSVPNGLNIPHSAGIGWLSDTVFQCDRATFSINSSNQVSFKAQFASTTYPITAASNGVTNPDTAELYYIDRVQGKPSLNIYTHDLTNNTVSESGQSVIDSTFFDNTYYTDNADAVLYDGKPYMAFTGINSYTSYFSLIGAATDKAVGSSVFGVAAENIAANTTGDVAVAGGEVSGLSGFITGKRYSYSTEDGSFQLGGDPFVVASSSSSIVVL